VKPPSWYDRLETVEDFARYHPVADISVRDVSMISSYALRSLCDLYPTVQEYVHDTHSYTIYDPNQYKPLKDAPYIRSVYVYTHWLKPFFEEFWPFTRPLVLVTGMTDHDATPDTIPDLDHPHLAHWFAQNYNGLPHPKITNLPIGLDYHTLSQNAKSWGPQQTPKDQEFSLLSRVETIHRAPCTAGMEAHHHDSAHWRKETRKKVYQKLKHEVIPLPKSMKRTELWDIYKMHSFIVSPHGNGLDCHRTWEILALGRIPIVRTSSLDPLYDGLPVMILDKYEDLNQERMVTFRQQVEDNWEQYEWRRLTLDYWNKMFHSPWEII